MKEAEWKRLEAQAGEIERVIRMLEQLRRGVLARDPEYAEYLDAFDLRGEGAPLSIGRFHQLEDELRAIGARMPPPDVEREFDQWYAENRERIVELERLLWA
jgi:hypothetical protein